MDHALLKFFLTDCLFFLIFSTGYHAAKDMKDEEMKDWMVKCSGVTIIIGIILLTCMIFAYL